MSIDAEQGWVVGPDGILFEDSVGLFGGLDDPTTSPPANAPTGSIYFKSDGKIFILSTANIWRPGYYSLALPGNIFGLKLSNNGSDPNNSLDISTGICTADTYDSVMTLSTAITKKLSASWTVGTNEGGLDTGSEAASTWYSVFVIKRPDTDVSDVLFSLSATAPTMPTNYTKQRRIGSIYNDASGNITAFTQINEIFLWASPVNAMSNGNITTTAANVTLRTPTGVSVDAMLNINSRENSEDLIRVYSTFQNDDTVTINNCTFQCQSLSTGVLGGSDSTRPGASLRVVTNTSSQIRVRASASTTGNYISCEGYIDWRGRLQ